MKEASITRSSNILARQTEEWARVESVLLHEPGREALFTLMQVDAHSTDAPYDLTAVQWDHQNYRFLLEARGIDVVSLRDALTRGTMDTAGEPLEGAALKRLRRLAGDALMYTFAPAVDEDRRRALLRRRERILQGAHPEVLVDLLFLRPIVRVGFGGDPSLLEYGIRPALAAHFVRDALVATTAGAVLGRASEPSRRWENRLMALALEQLGTRPIAEVRSPGHLEGGDFIPAGDFALLRIGPATNREAFRQLFAARAFGVKEVALVRDPNADMVHLDDYLAFPSPDIALVHEDRLKSDREPMVEVYAADPSRVEARSELSLSEYLKRRDIEPIPTAPCEPYTLSGVMVLGPADVVVAEGVGDSVVDTLRDNGVEVQVLSLEAAGGRGGLRGLTQVLRREGTRRNLDGRTR
ncbi:MAG: arginine deiminase family protein [Bacillota bacterium]